MKAKANDGEKSKRLARGTELWGITDRCGEAKNYEFARVVILSYNREQSKKRGGDCYNCFAEYSTGEYAPYFQTTVYNLYPSLEMAAMKALRKVMHIAGGENIPKVRRKIRTLCRFIVNAKSLMKSCHRFSHIPPHTTEGKKGK